MRELNTLDALLTKRRENSSLRQQRQALLQRRAAQGATYQASVSRAVDLVLVIDSTGSMDPFLELVKRKFGELLRHLCTESRLPRLRFSVVFYKDHGAEADGYDVKAYKGPTGEAFAEKSDIDKVINFIRQYGYCGGGGGSEALGAALYEVSNFAWRASQRVVINLGDQTSHGYDSSSWGDSLIRCPHRMSHEKIITTLKQKDIKLFSVCCGTYAHTRRQYQELSAATGGAYIEFDKLDTLEDIMLFLELALLTTTEQITPERFLEDHRVRHAIGQKSHAALLAAFSSASARS